MNEMITLNRNKQIKIYIDKESTLRFINKKSMKYELGIFKSDGNYIYEVNHGNHVIPSRIEQSIL